MKAGPKMMSRLHSEVSGGESESFTLIELLTALTILCVLLGLIIGISSYGRRSARVNETKAALGRLCNALQRHMEEYGAYPDSTNLDATAVTNWLPAGFVFSDAWGRPFQYGRLTPLSFRLFSYGPDGTNSADDMEAGR